MSTLIKIRERVAEPLGTGWALIAALAVIGAVLAVLAITPATT